VNQDSIPDELRLHASGTVASNDLQNVPGLPVGTEAADVLALMDQGAKFYSIGAYAEAADAFRKVTSARTLKVVITGVSGGTANDPGFARVQRLRIVGTTENYGASKASEPSVHAPRPPAPQQAEAAHELALVEARKRWRAKFQARVRAMETLLATAVEDQTPTPRADGDD
jgi:hypothetical protein